MFLSAFSSPATSSTITDSEIVSGYRLGKTIGFGGFSTVRLASSKSGGQVAVKIIRGSDLDKQGRARKRIDHEAMVWSSLSHEHILPLFSWEHIQHAYYFFTLYCPAGNLFDILKRDGRPALPQDDAGMMFRQVVRGLRYLHEVAGYVHRDIKLENVLVDEAGMCRIADFGMARKLGELEEWDEEEVEDVPVKVHRAVSVSVSATAKSMKPLSNHPSLMRHQGPRHRNSTSTHTDQVRYICEPGSLPYAAPELLVPPTSSGPRLPDASRDIWALGILLHALLTGRLPFTDSFEPRLQIKILHSVYEVPADIGRGAERVLKGCLDRVVDTRWTIGMVDEIAWGVGWEAEVEEASLEDLEQHRRRPTPLSRSLSRRPDERDIDLSMVRSPSSVRSPSLTREDAAARRSLSRNERSLSRAPILLGRRPSQQRRKSPGLSASVMSYSTSSSSSDGMEALSPSRSLDALSPSRSLERGRQLTKIQMFPSRSPSPSVAPRTPLDDGGLHHTLPEIRGLHDLGERKETSRGRKKFVRGLQNLYESELDNVEDSEWRSDFIRGRVNAEAHSSVVKMALPRIPRRPGSTPPALLSPPSWTAQSESSTAMGFETSTHSLRFVNESYSLSLKPGARSRSAECD
ncbi:kinase-like domain-containing protein [Mycena floridula]|nr:kinase-like domain-containing protein [Mycena floridula]